MKSKLIIAALIAAAPLLAIADEAKVYLPQFTQQMPICGAGEALTFTLQCDPGSRSPIGRTWYPKQAGVEICKVSAERCEPIPFPATDARPGFEVQDSRSGDLVVVSFGLDRLLGAQP